MDSPPNEINIQRQQQPPNFDDSSIYTTGDISDILLSPSPPRISTSKEKNQGEAVQQFSSLHFLNKSDLLIKISRIIFEDFQNNILILNSRNDGDSEGNPDDQFTEIIQKFMEVCECGVKGIEKICTEMGHVDPNSKNMLNKLTLERAAYSLMLRIHNSNKLLIDNQDLISTSFLTKLFRENDHFRRISILLLWSEECSMFSPTEFSRIADEDAMKLAGLDNIYACTKLRAPVNLDSRFVDRIAAEDEESVQTLNRVLFSLLRSGRLQDAKTLLDNVGLSALSAFIFIREFLNSPKLSPLDRFDDNFGLAQSRMHFKQTAKDLIPMDDERIQRTDHCIWATLGGHLPTLLSYAQCTDDRLWAYLSCAAEALLDQALCSFHAKLDDQISVLANDMVRENEDLPTTVHSIFTELQINEASPYYKLFAHLALEQWTAAAKFIDDCIQNKEQQMTAHELRFFVHLMLLLKLTRRPPNAQFMDRLIEQYSGLLIEMKLKGSVPLYLYHLSADQSVPRMLDFLEEIMLEPEQREVLESALSAGFDVTELCREIFYRFKAKYRFDNEQTEQQISKSADELVRAWKWLTYCMPETIWHAIVEANFILRKLFLHNRMSEATALMRMAPESLAADALKVFRNDYPDEQVPAKLLNATREFECYQLYFEAIRRYGEWQKQVEGSEAPEMPAKLSDERWARMDIRRRAEYELNVKKAREILQKYYRVVELYKKNAVEGLENVLKTPDGWLATSQADEESADQEVVERSHDFVEIRKQFLANLLELLVDVHSRSNESMRVLDVASLMMDPRYSLHKSITKDKLQKLLTQISANGAALL